MSILACTDLSVALGGVPIFSGIDLTLEAGKVAAVIGPNGAGKSTLLSCLAGLRDATTGQSTLDGVALSTMRPRDRAKRLAFLPQTPEIAWSVEARTLIELGRTPFIGARGQAAVDREAVDRAMAAAHVETFGNRVIDTLSGGERARVLIARALAGDPEWLLADEPLTGLDPAHQLDAAALFRGLADEGRGVLVTLHDLSLALRLADRVLVLAEGGIIADEPPASALSPEVLKRAYGVEATLTQGPGGPLVDVIRRA
ncbi:ABC transporter ATP-binding protein [Brevundimonas sp. NIBR11]|uniref:ABC transporter ATP-binding protein n=1 Tax=Brevundimonas sp. NIBR11 TaxID=3015999 RepID=UPI0022F02AF8|nr:ABC transporter ATP-binding protein [Brevundimonas sp. NIBR11]WGM31156.1 Petrobactin import ATP-binding protein FpuC [Brevundimonas sp. NIBR11]